MDNMHKIDFSVNLTGSFIFDEYMYLDALKMCNLFPGLDCSRDEKTIRVFGELNDYWWDKYNKVQIHMPNIR